MVSLKRKYLPCPLSYCLILLPYLCHTYAHTGMDDSPIVDKHEIDVSECRWQRDFGGIRGEGKVALLITFNLLP
jgi:hypothetical protein